MNEDKIKNSFQAIKYDINNLRETMTEILSELKSNKKSFDTVSKSNPNQGKIFTSKVFVNEDIRNSVNEVFDSGIFTSGEKAKGFEKKFSEYCGIKHAVSVSDGTVAIELVLRALEIGKGDEVIVPSHTTMPTVEPILHLGATPVFVDCLEDSYNLNPKEVAKKITKKTKAVIAVHLYGNPVNLDLLVEICNKNNVYLIEDCAQAHGARYNGKHVGTFGIAACFSFYPTKNLTVCGEGGMIITNNDEIAKKTRMMATHGEDGRYNHVILGSNHRLAEIPAAIGIKQLELLESFVERRRHLANIYHNALKGTKGIILPLEEKNAKHSYHLYVIRVDKDIRDKVIDRMKEHNIFLGIHYPRPVHQQVVVKNILKSKIPKLKVTEKIVKEIISLPMYPLLRDEEAKMIAEMVKAVIKTD